MQASQIVTAELAERKGVGKFLNWLHVLRAIRSGLVALKTVGVYLLKPGYCFVHVAGLVPISERVYILLFLQVYKYWARSFFFCLVLWVG